MPDPALYRLLHPPRDRHNAAHRSHRSFGVLSYSSLPLSNLPEIGYPTIHVQAALPCANPDAIAAALATPLESECSRIPGIEHMTSTSQVGQAGITLQFA